MDPISHVPPSLGGHLYLHGRPRRVPALAPRTSHIRLDRLHRRRLPGLAATALGDLWRAGLRTPGALLRRACGGGAVLGDDDVPHAGCCGHRKRCVHSRGVAGHVPMACGSDERERAVGEEMASAKSGE